jgi:hypothetical protein
MIKGMWRVERDVLHFVKRRRGPVEVLEIKFNLDHPLDLINEAINRLIIKGHVCEVGNGQECLSLISNEELCSNLSGMWI